MRKTKEQNTKHKIPKTNNGITLIALIITIIVMIILVAVTVTIAVNGGLFSKAQIAGTQTNEAVKKEQELGKGKINIAGQDYNSPQEYVDTITGGNSGGEKVYLAMDNEETDSGIGYYVKIGEQYGVIYADLAYDGSGEWGNEDWGYYSYSYSAEESPKLKKYYVDGTYDPGDEYGTAWGEKPLLVADEEINETEGRTINRFYVMALTDYTANGQIKFYWDYNYNGIDFGTSTNFGTGKDNTELLINTTEVTWANQDIWNNLSNSSNWFVPSKAEWAAFGQRFRITLSTYPDLGLSPAYWTSSEMDEYTAWYSDLSCEHLENEGGDKDLLRRVRVSWPY